MRSAICKKLAAGGLVLVTGPLSLTAVAQEYVDLEAERAAREAAGRPAAQADPYGVRPAQSYPATSYGLDRTPASPPVTATPPPPVAGGAVGAGSNIGSLFYQLQQLQQEVMQLNGRVEEQANEIRMLREQSLERYMELDRRLAEGGGAPATGAAPAGQVVTAPVVAATAPSGASAGKGIEQPGEANSYRAAYALVQGRDFQGAVKAFTQFLDRYPTGKYAANAHYWLGELYLVVEPRNLEASRQSFALLLSEYPDNPKAPDALYKLGKVQFEKGNREKAREYLDLVISQYSGANPDVARLAREFIAENY